MPHRGIEPASAACWSDALPTELHPLPRTFRTKVQVHRYEGGRERDRQTDRQAGRDTQRQAERQRQKDLLRETEAASDRDRQTDTC